MQYQLWVIQGGKPVSMGVLPNSMANTPSIQKIGMRIESGEAFAISLEKAGGSPTPTMEQIYVLGKA
jgi:anti-sigma-K factor RskA